MKIDLASIKTVRDVARQVYPVPANPISLLDLFRRHDFRTTEIRSLRALLQRWNPADGAVAFSVLWQNTFLMRIVAETVVPIPVPPFWIEKDVVVVEKPDTLDRAGEFGAMLAASDFDLAFLCEVWTPDVKALLLAPLAGKFQSFAEGPLGGTSTVVLGPGFVVPSIANTGSGLCALGKAPVIIERAFHTFTSQGSLPRDSDALSQKSVLLCRVNAGPGVLDVYSTHLFNGGGLTGGDPPADEKLGVQVTQIKEIVQFMKDTHDPGHVAVLIGDFNLDGNDQGKINGFTPYQVLMGLLSAEAAPVKFVNVWPFQFAQAAGTPSDEQAGTLGITDLGEEAPVLAGICSIPNGSMDGTCSEDENAFPTLSRRGRLDYLFVERVRESHKINVAVSALRRKPFPRDGKFPFLSDHLGLTFNLVCSPR